MHMSQRHFANLFGLSIGTLRHWERGRRRPGGAALVLLHVIAHHPRAVREAVLKARFRGARLAPVKFPMTARAGPGMSVPMW